MAYDELPDLGSGDVLTVAWVDQVEANATAFRGIAQPVTELPASPAAGDTVRYTPVAAGSPPVWLCTWDTNLNGGMGAWSVTGPPIYATPQSSFGTAHTASVFTFAAMPNGPSVALAYAGVYIINAGGALSQGASANWQCRVRGSVSGATTDVFASALGASTGDGYPAAGVVQVTTTAAGTATLQAATNNIAVVVGELANFWKMAVYPVELRP